MRHLIDKGIRVDIDKNITAHKWKSYEECKKLLQGEILSEEEHLAFIKYIIKRLGI